MLTLDFSWFPMQAGGRCLDVGCGEGRHSLAAYLKPDIDVVGVDLSYADLQTARARIADMEAFDPQGCINFCRATPLACLFPMPVSNALFVVRC